MFGVAGGEGLSGRTSPLRGEVLYVAGGAGPSQTQQIDEPLAVGRGQAVGPLLATSSDGGDIAADLLAADPVQVICACVLSSYRCPPVIARILLC